MQIWLYAINLSCQNSGYLIKPTSQSPVKVIQHFIQLDIFLDNNLDIFFLYNHYPRSYPNFKDNHDLTIGYLLSKFYTIGHRSPTKVILARKRMSCMCDSLPDSEFSLRQES